MRKRTLAAMCLMCSVSLLASTSSSSAAPPRSEPLFKLNPIHATLVPLLRETRYSANVQHMSFDHVHVTWQLTLELVDKAAEPSPGTPGSGAAIDWECTNAGVGVPHPTTEVGMQEEPFGSSYRFIWHHPDPADSVPFGKYRCNHLDMGPHGHQGLITIVVSDGTWRCTATYKGTNSSNHSSVADKTASEEDCKKLAR